jgi:hypothetical protein
MPLHLHRASTSTSEHTGPHANTGSRPDAGSARQCDSVGLAVWGWLSYLRKMSSTLPVCKARIKLEGPPGASKAGSHKVDGEFGPCAH